jgi:hypothetical protein
MLIVIHLYQGKKSRGDYEMTWGGKRPGAGRKPSGRGKKIYYVTQREDQEIRKLIEKMRGENIMYKVETIDYLNGEYLPGTEAELYSGKDKDEARMAFEKFVESDSVTAIGSKQEDDGRWEIIWEK